jgi:hypothetical protein
MSETLSGLQTMLKCPEEFCPIYKMEVTAPKSEVVVLNSGFADMDEATKWLFNNKSSPSGRVSNFRLLW